MGSLEAYSTWWITAQKKKLRRNSRHTDWGGLEVCITASLLGRSQLFLSSSDHRNIFWRNLFIQNLNFSTQILRINKSQIQCHRKYLLGHFPKTSKFYFIYNTEPSLFRITSWHTFAFNNLYVDFCRVVSSTEKIY